MKPAGQTAADYFAPNSSITISGQPMAGTDIVTQTQATEATVIAGGLVFVAQLINGAFWGAVIGAGVNLLSGGRKKRSRRSSRS